ncbi:MAG: 4-aminobutyrate--2-oxoglutarate transaminase [Kiloniellales bacterium]
MSDPAVAQSAAAPGQASNAELQALREQAVPRGVATMLPVFAARARNAELWDVEGKRYIDFASGIAVLNTGHNHPKIKAAVARQLENFSHTCFQVVPYEDYVRLAARLNAVAPGPTPKKTIFFSTGAEAVENAIKIARAHTRRPAIVSFSGAFHGRTMMGMALTGKVAPYKLGFGPFPGGVYHLPFPIAYHGVSVAESLKALETLFKADVEPSQVAAMIVEPVQGEGGFYIAPKEFLQKLRAICDQHGILLIADEIQTGFARTGKLFAIEHSGVEPDLMTLAKSLAGGFPLSAVTGKAQIMDAPLPGGLGGTYAGSPIACAAAHAVLDVIEEEGLCARAVAIGRRMTEQLKKLAGDNALGGTIGEVRGLGAMVAVELIEEGDPARPAAELTRDLVQSCASNGLVVLSCGVRANVIRFLVPLTASDAIVDEGMAILGDTLKSLVKPK